MTDLSYGLLILPLLGGFIFVKTSDFFRFKVYRYSNQELFFLSAVWGTFLFVPAYLASIYVSTHNPALEFLWKQLFNFEYSFSTFSTLFWGFTLGKCSNFFTTKEIQVEKLIRDDNDAIEIILLKALKEAKMISVTLSSNKVYVGFISINFISPNFDTKSIKLIPYLSGYRNPKSKEIIFTNYYESITKRIEDEDEEDWIGFESSDFEIGMFLSDVISVNIFHPKVYDLFQEEMSTTPQNQLDLFSN